MVNERVTDMAYGMANGVVTCRACGLMKNSVLWGLVVFHLGCVGLAGRRHFTVLLRKSD